MDEPNKDQVVQTFTNSMNDAIQAGLLFEKFDLEEALKPPPPQSPAPSPTPNPPDGVESPGDDKNLESRELSTGAVAGIVIAVIAVLYGVALSAIYVKRRRGDDDEEFDLERQEVGDSAVMQDFSSPDKDDDSEANTESNTSQDHLLSSTFLTSSKPALGNLDDESESGFSESSVSSLPAEEPVAQMSSPLAALAMASTLVVSQNSNSSASQSEAVSR